MTTTLPTGLGRSMATPTPTGISYRCSVARGDCPGAGLCPTLTCESSEDKDLDRQGSSTLLSPQLGLERMAFQARGGGAAHAVLETKNRTERPEWMRGSRMVIPPQGQAKVLELLHETHPGASRMKILARSYVWWPSMNETIEERVKKSCTQKHQPRLHCTLGNDQNAPGPSYTRTTLDHSWERCFSSS